MENEERERFVTGSFPLLERVKQDKGCYQIRVDMWRKVAADNPFTKKKNNSIERFDYQIPYRKLISMIVEVEKKSKVER